MIELKKCMIWPNAGRKMRADDQEITHFPMTAFTVVSVTARIFYMTVIDTPEVENSGWLAALIGAAFSFPAILGAYFLMKKHNGTLSESITQAVGEKVYRIFCMILSLALMYETSALISILTSSGAYATLYNMHKLLLLIPTAVAVIFACSKGGNGLGGSSEVWIRINLLLYAVVLLLEYDTADMSYIFPIFGPGTKVLLNTGRKIMTYYLLIPVSFMVETGYAVIGRNEHKKTAPESILKVYCLCIGISFLLLLIHSFMYPSLSPVFKSRSDGMDLMLSNGRSNRTVQLPILIIWFSSLFICASYMLFASGRLMNSALKEKGRKCQFLLGIISMVIALFRLSDQSRSAAFSAGFGPLLSFVFLILACVSLFKKKEKAK